MDKFSEENGYKADLITLGILNNSKNTKIHKRYEINADP